MNDPIRNLIAAHLTRYPKLDIVDVYKLLHQGVFGPGHAIKYPKQTREWLERESELAVAAVTDAASPMLESVHPEGSVVRLHLRPYLTARGDLNKLLNAFIDSSKAVEGKPEMLADWWGQFEQMTQPGGAFAGRFDLRTLALITRARIAENWAACHHSPVFNFEYKPYYRVLSRDLADRLLNQQSIAFVQP